MRDRPKIPAAQYLRKSTDEQANSIPLQEQAIQHYATAHGFEVVKTYSDAAKSGVLLLGRSGLQQLLGDVIAGKPGFQAILVYDVSRWGRFQDIDESAHYEFLCKRAGVRVHYCAEQFQNDGSMPNEIMKALKRTMAAEFSRELAEKVRAGLRRLAMNGFHCGSPACYGLRRMVIPTNGGRGLILQDHQVKNLRSDHVVLVPGPKAEVECVRSIFSMAERRKTPSQIAAELNQRKIKYSNGKPWDSARVWRLLKNETYTGWSIWGRTTKPFSQFTIKLSRKQWCFAPNEMTSLVDRRQFYRVQRLLDSRNRSRTISKRRLLHDLERVLKRYGGLSKEMIGSRGKFSDVTYRKRFGSLTKAFHLVGYSNPVVERSAESIRKMALLKHNLIEDIRKLFGTRLRVVPGPSRNRRPVIELDSGERAAIQLCAISERLHGQQSWRFKVNRYEADLISLICLPNKTLTGFTGFYVLPSFQGIQTGSKTLRKGHDMLKWGTRIGSLDKLYNAVKLAARKPKDKVLAVDDTVFSCRGSRLTIGSLCLNLPPMQAKVLSKLISRPDRFVSLKVLSRCNSAHTKRSVVSLILKIRKALGARLENRIVAAEGRGYKFISIRNVRTAPKNVVLWERMPRLAFEKRRKLET